MKLDKEQKTLLTIGGLFVSLGLVIFVYYFITQFINPNSQLAQIAKNNCATSKTQTKTPSSGSLTGSRTQVASANTVRKTLAWNPSPDIAADPSNGAYILYYSNHSGSYSKENTIILPGSQTSYTTGGLSTYLNWYFVVTAAKIPSCPPNPPPANPTINDYLQSAYSNEAKVEFGYIGITSITYANDLITVQFSLNSGAPYQVQMSQDNVNWSDQGPLGTAPGGTITLSYPNNGTQGPVLTRAFFRVKYWAN